MPFSAPHPTTGHPFLFGANMKATITVRGSWAELYGPVEVLQTMLTIPDPQRFHSLAFREERWDGMVKLYDGNRFPAGLVERVSDRLAEDGHTVAIVSPEEVKPVDTSRMGPKYLMCGPKRNQPLWDHQLKAIMAMLENSRGIVKSPTSSGKTEIIGAVAQYLWEERGWRSLIVVPKKGLASQTVKRLRGYYGNSITVGQCGDGLREVGDVTVGTAQTVIHYLPQMRKNGVLPPDPKLRKLVRETEVLFLDEAHHTSAESWYRIAMDSGALRKFGLSGTPLKNDELSDLKLIGATGEIICTVVATELIELGISAKPKICVVYSPKVSGPDLPSSTYLKWVNGKPVQTRRYLPYPQAYQRGIIGNVHHNRAVIRAVEWFVDHDRRVLILCRRRPHWQTLHQMLDDAGLDHMALWGATGMYEREDAKKLLDGGKTKVILATTIFDEGEDVPGVDALVLAEGVKVSVNALQRIGRGMRRKVGANEVWVVDICPTCHPTLSKHALNRVQAYEGEGYDVQVCENWPDYNSAEELLPFLNWDLTSAGK